MKLATFAKKNSVSENSDHPHRLGVVKDERIFDITAVADRAGEDIAVFSDMIAFLERGKSAMDFPRSMIEDPESPSHAMDEVRLLAPIPRPPSLRDCMVFERHLQQAMRTVAKRRSRVFSAVNRLLSNFTRGDALLPIPKAWYEAPVYYKGNPRSVVGHDADVVWPRYTSMLDYELEIAIVISKTGKDIPVSSAHEYIGGYAIFNDFSARDVQLREMQARLGPAKGKDFDTGNAIGPYLTTPDEIKDVGDLKAVAKVNGEVWAQSDTTEMNFTFEEIIAHISQSETIYPGDIIGAGTVPNGCGLELDRWINPGDVIELEVEGLGTLRNRVVGEV